MGVDQDIHSKLDAHSQTLMAAIERIQMSTGDSDGNICDVMSLSSEELTSVRNGERELPLTSLARLAEHYSLSFEGIIRGEIDPGALRAHRHGDHRYIPERFMKSAFSKRRTVTQFLDFAERFFGPEFRGAVLRRFQVKEAAFHDPEAPINVDFVMKLFEHFAIRGFGEEHFKLMGLCTRNANRGSPLEAALAKISTPARLFEKLIGEMTPFFERNCNYRVVKLSTDSCVVASSDNRDVADSLGLRRIGNRHGCDFRAGVLASTTTYAGLPAAVVHEVSCVHDGDPECVFFVDYQAAFAAAPRLSLVPSA